MKKIISKKMKNKNFKISDFSKFIKGKYFFL